MVTPLRSCLVVVIAVVVLACRAAPDVRPPPPEPATPPRVEPPVPVALTVESPPIKAAPPVSPEEACQNWWSPACQAYGKPATCASSIADVPKGALCGLQGSTPPLECTFPEGRCRCIHQPYCGGAAPSMLQQNAMRWECRPPATPDDCPDLPPGDGGVCAISPKECGYGGCGSSTTCQCSGGRWHCAQRYWAPPP